MSVSPSLRPFYLPAAGQRFLSLLSLPDDGRDPDIGVLIVPPFGWDDVCSYRGRHDWAFHFADSGIPCLRIDLPGTGDSEGWPDDPGRVGAWIEATRVGAQWLREHTGCRRLCVVGLGLGGLLACEAARTVAIDELSSFGQFRRVARAFCENFGRSRALRLRPIRG